ncbi:MAG: hypothetical protein KF735_00820 [Chelatococcus sp.]|uniref:hypothetical protein n=1 Tax=Chelatococcus sp. TaxID=1953771 RepID=UPI0025B88E2B|nr:hypothetical protein [Chelatococcus sp.]MBX3536151.1 hypothetical protein [Chelatococcus sp.]
MAPHRLHLAMAAVLALPFAGLAGFSSAQERTGGSRTSAEVLAVADATNPEWREAAARALPSAWVLGRLYRIDEAAGKAFFAAFPKGADTPWTPGNAFDFGQTVEVALKTTDHRRVVSEVRIYTASPEDRDTSDIEQVGPGSELYAAAQAEGRSGVMVCRIRGWALGEGSAGTAVRRRPSDDAPIVGRLARPYLSDDNDASAIDGWRAAFDITGYKDGWFRINKATPPGSLYGDDPPRGHPKTYAGAGWVRVTEVTGAYSNTQMPVPRLLQYPNVDALAFQPGENAADANGNLSIDGTLTRLHACSGHWALTTSRDGQRGWWRGICSNQVTNCS